MKYINLLKGFLIKPIFLKPDPCVKLFVVVKKATKLKKMMFLFTRKDIPRKTNQAKRCARFIFLKFNKNRDADMAIKI